MRRTQYLPKQFFETKIALVKRYKSTGKPMKVPIVTCIQLFNYEKTKKSIIWDSSDTYNG